MELIIIILIIVLLLFSLVGSFVPVLPGPPLGFLALLLFHFFINPVSFNILMFVLILVLGVTFLDYWLQIYGVKKAGGGKYAIRGSMIGLIFGFFFPPLGIIVGAFIGAFIGAKIEADKNELNIALGSVVGFVIGTILKICVSSYIIYIILFL